jgi:flagellar protein FliS
MAYPRAANVAAYQTAATHGKVAAADEHGLVQMLLEGVLDRIAQARGCIEHGDAMGKAQLIHRCVAIVEELRQSLDFESGGEIAANLGELYSYIARQLLNASIGNRVDLLNEAASLLNEIRSAWSAIPAEARARPAAAT